MYSREQIAKLKQTFWTSFGQYMAAVPSADGEKINWINYKTGHKHLYFRMDADQQCASISIKIVHPDLGIQELIFEQFKTFEKLLHQHQQEDWDWLLHTQDEYSKTISLITKEIHPVSILQKDNWPQLISFFKPRIIALDAFWNLVKYHFDDLK